MPRLIHLNGAPGVGKSTLARRYVNEHPGVLNLDIDTVVPLLGGWREDFFGVLPAARALALAMTRAHLGNGADVVMPQLVANVAEARRFELAARDVGAGYLEIVLIADPREQQARFRGRADGSEVAAHVKELASREEGDEVLWRIQRDLDRYLNRRPGAVRLDTGGAVVEATYTQLLVAVAGR